MNKIERLVASATQPDRFDRRDYILRGIIEFIKRDSDCEGFKQEWLPNQQTYPRIQFTIFGAYGELYYWIDYETSEGICDSSHLEVRRGNYIELLFENDFAKEPFLPKLLNHL